MKEVSKGQDFDEQSGQDNVQIGYSVKWLKTLSNAFPALASRNFKLYFLGQLVSLIGTWLQIVAQGWLVLKMTNSPLLIGLVTALATLPSLFLTLFGGVIVDRYSKKKILLSTQTASMFLALILGILTVSELITIWEICVIAFLLGIVTAIDTPARQAFVSELVNKDQLPSAIALNSGAFNAARVIGPGVAGILIGLIGTGGAFLLNAASFLAVIIALIFLDIKTEIQGKKGDTLVAIKEGLVYSFTHPVIRTLVIFTGISSIFGWSYTTLMPIIAKNTFHVGATELGYLYSAAGLGSLTATIIIAAFSKKISPVFFILGGNTLFSLSLLGFTYTNNIAIAYPLLFLAGLGLLAQFAMINTTIQRLVKPEFRGRVLSIYILMFLGLTPAGNFQVGWVAEHYSPGFPIRIGAVVLFIFGAFIFFYLEKIRANYQEYKKNNEFPLD